MFVYFMEAGPGGHIKIGTAVNPQARVRDLQTGNASRLAILASFPGGEAEEAELHRRFASAKLHGEWFERTPDLMALVESHIQPGPEPQLGPAITFQHAPARETGKYTPCKCGSCGWRGRRRRGIVGAACPQCHANGRQMVFLEGSK